MNIKLILMTTVVTAGLATLTFADGGLPNCNYSMPTYLGVACNQLPYPQPQTAVAVGTCKYDYCNLTVTCASNSSLSQTYLRTRDVWKWTDTNNPNNIIYYTDGNPHDQTDGCCNCITSYQNQGSGN